METDEHIEMDTKADGDVVNGKFSSSVDELG